MLRRLPSICACPRFFPYFASDLRELTPQQIVASHAVSGATEAAQLEAANAIIESETPAHTFNILAMQEMGQHTDLFLDWKMLGGKTGTGAYIDNSRQFG